MTTTRPYLEASPKILTIEWGRMEVDGLTPDKDYMLYPGGGQLWDWKRSNTRHRPGVQPMDVRELIDHGAQVVVISRGMQLRLEVAPRTLELLERLSVPVHVEETTVAVRIYNELVEKETPVGGLFHTTC